MPLLLRNPNLYYGGLRRRKPRRRGAGFFSSIGNALSKAHDWVKNNKIISTVGNALGSVGVPYAGAIGKAAGTIGYGARKRRTVRRRAPRKRGGALNLRSLLSSAHKFIKDKKLVSGALSHFGHSKLSAGASALGYGRRRRVGRPRKATVARRRRQGGSLRSILSSAHKFIKDKRLVSSALSHFGHPKLSAGASALGYGRRRRAPARRMLRHSGGANFFSTSQLAVPRW